MPSARAPRIIRSIGSCTGSMSPSNPASAPNGTVPALRVGAMANWQDDIYRNEADGAVIRQASYATLGLMARYEINRNFSVNANINNVTDKKYLTSLYWSQGFSAAPRNASVTLNWKY